MQCSNTHFATMLSMWSRGILISTFAGTAAEIVCQKDFQNTADMGGRADTDQRLGYWTEGAGHGHLLCQGIDANGTVVKSTCEFNGANIGFKTGWQSANPHGEVRWELTEVNGQSVSKGTLEVPAVYTEYELKSDDCGTGDGGDPFQFSDAMVVENKLGGTSATITALAFLNDGKKKDVLKKGKAVYSVEADMGSCKLEMMVKIPVNPDGDTTFAININFHKDEGEEELNAGLTAENKDNMVEISSDLDAADGSKVVLVMARGLVCESTESNIANEDITISDLSRFPEDRSFTYSVSKSAADGCEFLYWDPTMTPFGGSGGSSGAVGLSLAGVAATLLTAVQLI